MNTLRVRSARILLPACLLLVGIEASPATELLAAFTESRGCRVIGSATSIARLKEIAAQGTVTWDGKCNNGLIDGPGALRHQGVVRENERNRRYAFYLTGTAAAGKRQGTWLRETFNMFEDSSKYWTSLATISYVDGVSRGSPKLLTVRSDADFSPAFRQFLAEADRKLAAAHGRTDQSAVSEPGAVGIVPPPPIAAPSPSLSAPAPSSLPAPVAPPVALPAPAPLMSPVASSPPAAVAPPVAVSPAPPVTAQAPAPALESPPPSTAPLAATPSKPATPAPGSATAGTQAPASQRNQKPALASAPARAAAPGSDPVRAPVGGFQGRGLQPSGETGLRLGSGAAAPIQQQKLLEQTDACYVDEINDAIVGADPIIASSANPLRIAGWAADPHGPRIPAQAWVRLFDRGGGPGMLIEMPRNVERPDVAKAMGDPAYAKAGFRLAVAAGRLAPGEYTVAIVQQLGSEIAVCTAVGRLSLR